MCRFSFSRFSKCWPTETKIFSLWNSQPKPTKVIGNQSVSVGFRFRSVFSVSYFLRKQIKKKKLTNPKNPYAFPRFLTTQTPSTKQSSKYKTKKKKREREWRRSIPAKPNSQPSTLKPKNHEQKNPNHKEQNPNTQKPWNPNHEPKNLETQTETHKEQNPNHEDRKIKPERRRQQRRQRRLNPAGEGSKQRRQRGLLMFSLWIFGWVSWFLFMILSKSCSWCLLGFSFLASWCFLSWCCQWKWERTKPKHPTLKPKHEEQNPKYIRLENAENRINRVIKRLLTHSFGNKERKNKKAITKGRTWTDWRQVHVLAARILETLLK